MADRKPSLYKTNWNKFEEAMNDVVRKEVCRVFQWLYKGGPKYVGQYLDEIKGGKKGLYKSEKNMLAKREPPTNMDITLLYRLLQRTCGLTKKKRSKPSDPNSTSLEHTLHLIKEERNKLGHEGHKLENREMSDAELDGKLSHLRYLCANLLTEASRRCGRLTEIVKIIDNMETRLQEIQGITADRFIQMAKEEKQRGTLSRVADEWYQQPLLRLKSQAVRLDDLLKGQPEDVAARRLLLISGEAGIGKSALCRYLEKCWVMQRSNDKDLLYNYRLVLRVHCGEICTCDAVRLLKEELLPETASRCSSDTLSEILRTEPILWVMDGLEEATEEADKLLSSLLRKRCPKINVLLTSRPEFVRDFLRRHYNGGTQIAVSLLGAEPLEAIQRIILSTKRDADTVRHAKGLMEEFEKLDRHVQKELHNPLKLRLALQGWQAMRDSSLRQEFELSRLYQKITNAQIESLSEKLSDGSTMTKLEAKRKVRKWFFYFRRSTFYLVQSRKISWFIGNTKKKFLKKMEDKCDELKISSTKCFSTFLANSNSVFSRGSNSYTFYHISQAHFLAASHIASVMKGSRDLPNDTLKLFNITALQESASEVPPLLHFFPVLLLLISLIDHNTPDDNIRMVIKLFMNAIHIKSVNGIWFRVAKKALYQPKVMREIATVIPLDWLIEESSIEAARKMVEYRQPEQVTLRVFSKPEEVTELEALISTLSSLPIAMRLYLLNHTLDVSGSDTADAYLEIICSKESRCILEAFEAHLGTKGYELLTHPNITDSCRAMKVKIKSTESLEILCERVQGFESLKMIHLLIAIENFQNNSAKLPNVEKFIELPFITKESVKNTANFVARFSLNYAGLYVEEMDYKTIETFVRLLQERGVLVDEFSVIYRETNFNFKGIPFGPLPIEYSWEEFRCRWFKYKSKVSKNRNNTEARRDKLFVASQ